MLTISHRQKDIFLYLLTQKKYIPLNALAKHFHVSKRTVQNDVSSLNIQLQATYGIAIDGVPHKGLRIDITREQKQWIYNEVVAMQVIYFDKTQRVVLIEALLLLRSTITFAEIADYVMISKQTILNDFPEVEERFHKEQFLIRRIKGYGVVVQGEEWRIRQYFHRILWKQLDQDDDLLSMIKNGMDEHEFVAAKELIQLSETILEVTYMEEERLLYAIAFAIHRIHMQKELSQLPYGLMNQVKHTTEAILLMPLLLGTYGKNETYALIFLFQCAKLYESRHQTIAREEKDAEEIAKYFAHEVTALINSKKEDVSFLHQLQVHLKVALYRMRNQIDIENDLVDQIKINIPLIFEFTQTRILQIERQYPYTFDDKEIAYIAMHIAAFYEIHIQLETRITILLVCSFGLATSMMLKTRILSIMGNMEIIGPMAKEEANTFLQSHDVDLIISTNSISSFSTPFVVVHAILLEEDILVLRERLLQIFYEKSCSYFLRAFRKEHRKEVIYLKNFVEEGTIQIIDEIADWKEAIQYAAAPLLQKKWIEQRYVNSMIDAVMQFGNYMILTPQTAFVHAGKDAGIKQTCIAILVMKKTVLFGTKNQEPVHTIVVLGLKDKEESSLLNIISIFGTKENQEKLRSKQINIDMIYELKSDLGGVS